MMEDSFVSEISKSLARKDHRKATLELAGMVVALMRRVERLEQRQYRGVWKGDEHYAAGSSVTHAGSLWVATLESKGLKPGDGQAWKLAVKNGHAAPPPPSRVARA
jgi:hypothetical protein